MVAPSRQKHPISVSGYHSPWKITGKVGSLNASYFLETRSQCVSLTGLELDTQAVLKLTEINLSQPSKYCN